MIHQALYGDGNHFAGDVIRPGAADFPGLESIILGTVTVDDFDVATALFGPQAMSRDLSAEQCADQPQQDQ
ncbi:hypothetical protein D3C80_1792310 [compost metagenome]